MLKNGRKIGKKNHAKCPDYFYFLISCIHLSCQTPNTPNASTQNARQKCKGSINAIILLLSRSGGCVLSADCSKRRNDLHELRSMAKVLLPTPIYHNHSCNEIKPFIRGIV